MKGHTRERSPGHWTSRGMAAAVSTKALTNASLCSGKADAGV
jgi:hypothetical protein